MQIDRSSIRSGQAVALDGIVIELSGWMIPLEDTPRVDYFLLVADAPCCGGCAPADPLSNIGLIITPVQILPRRSDAIGGKHRRAHLAPSISKK
jgi:membrane dipeptidase